MSIMLAVRHRGQIAVAADSLWSGSWDHDLRAQPKVERHGKTVLTVGPACGYSEALADEVLEFIGTGEDWPRRWPRHCLGAPEDGALERLGERDNASILVVWEGRVFEVYAKGSIFEHARPVAAIGCGADFAKGAATVLLPKAKTAKEVAVRAAEVACELSAGCAPPIICEVVKA